MKLKLLCLIMALLCAFGFLAGCKKDNRKTSGKKASTGNTVSQTESTSATSESEGISLPFVPKEKSATQSDAEKTQTAGESQSASQSEDSESSSKSSDNYEGAGY